jgi:hypothetical protein
MDRRHPIHADHFGGLVAAHAGIGCIDGDIPTLGVESGDTGHGIREGHIHLIQRLLRLLLRGDVHHQPAKVSRATLSIFDHTHDVPEPDDAAISRHGPVLEVVIAAFQGAVSTEGHGLLAVVRMNMVDPEIRLSQPPLSGVP